MLTNFFVHTAILPNWLCCTAIWLPSKQMKKWGADKADLKVCLRLQEDPTLTLTSLRSATSALVTGLWKQRMFDFLLSDEFEKVGAYWAYWQHHGQPSSSTLSPHTMCACECAADPLPSRSSGALHGGLWEGALNGRVCEGLAGLHARWPDFSTFYPGLVIY